MKYIDVTLRDGGHQRGFNWPLEFVNRYLTSINAFPEIGFVELGYWKQKDKFDGPFYSIEEELLSSICKMTKKKLSIMVDYHYCSHNVEDFPSTTNFNELGLIRVCLRKEDISEGCKFVNELKNYTKCKISINFFNITNFIISHFAIYTPVFVQIFALRGNLSDTLVLIICNSISIFIRSYEYWLIISCIVWENSD